MLIDALYGIFLSIICLGGVVTVFEVCSYLSARFKR
jgi:hypothetical protein